MTDAEKAAVWVRYDEGRSMRSIARELQMSVSTVCGILKEDPLRLRALRDRLREERADRFAELEERSHAVAHRVMDRLEDVTADTKTFTKAFQSMNVTGAAKALQALATTAQGAARTHELLTGQPTERTETPAAAASEDDALVAQAVALGKECVEALPVSLRERAQALLNERSRPAT